MTKIIFIVADGIGDRPIKELKYKTPLEAAKTPNLDRLAKEGICGLLDNLGRGIRPGSDVAHLSLFGYPYKDYYSGRGVFEVIGIPMELKEGDIAFRGNLATVENGIITDRRAGRMESVQVIPKNMKVQIEDVAFILTPGVLHRVGVVMRGPGLTHNIFDIDPHIVNVAPNKKLAKDDLPESKKTERILNLFMEYMIDFLQKQPANIKRKSESKTYANYLNLRGPGVFTQAPAFSDRYNLKACCISGADLYKGVAKYLGMNLIDVPGATGRVDSDLNAKIKEAVKRTSDYDFIFVHMKFADSLAEVGDFMGKKKYIERIDKALKPLFSLKDCLVFISGDHTTSCTIKLHTGDPVPALIWGPKEIIRTDDVKTYGERACQKGGLGRFEGITVMPELINLIGRQHMVGD